MTHGPSHHSCGGSCDPPKGRQGPTRVTAAAAAAPLRLLPSAAATECRHEGWSPPPSRPRSRAQGCTPVLPEQWRRLSHVHRPVTTLGLRLRHGAPGCPPPPTGVEAESPSARVATCRGAGEGCGDGALRRRTGADDDSDRRGLCGPAPESGLSAALASTQPCEGNGRPPLTPTPVSCLLHPRATFLVHPVVLEC